MNLSGPLPNTLMQTDVGFASTADQPNRYTYECAHG